MAVEYEHFLLPVDNSFFPESAKVKELLGAMVKDKWLPVPIDGRVPVFRHITIREQTVRNKERQKEFEKLRYSRYQRVFNFFIDRIFFRGLANDMNGPSCRLQADKRGE